MGCKSNLRIEHCARASPEQKLQQMVETISGLEGVSCKGLFVYTNASRLAGLVFRSWFTTAGHFLQLQNRDRTQTDNTCHERVDAQGS